MYTRTGSNWGLQQAFREASSEQFGVSVDLEGDTLVAGAWGGDSAYIFTRTGSTWTQRAALLNDSQYFGYAVATNGDSVAVGAYGYTSTRGAVHIFAPNSSGVWTQRAKFVGDEDNDYGYSVAMRGNSLIVGTQNALVGNHNGEAYIYAVNGGSWTLQDKLVGTTPSGRFGNSVAMAGDLAVVSATSEQNGQGAAYVFSRDGNSWTREDRLVNSDAEDWGYFGRAAAISGTTIVAGAATIYSSDVGKAYVYEAIDEAPVVDDQYFSIPENSGRGEVVGTVLADDAELPNDVLTWSITDGNTFGAFEIEPTNGEITVANQDALDYETTQVFNLTVEVEDSVGETDDAVITISLNDIVEADLSITKVADVDSIVAGNTLTYTITVSNLGPQIAENVTVTDTLPAEVTFVSTSGCVEDPTGVPTCTLGDIDAGGSAQFTITVTVDPTTFGTITNTASVTFDAEDPDAFDPDPDNNATWLDTEVLKRVFYVSSNTGGTVDGIDFENEDILAYEPVTDRWSMFFDGSQVGLSRKDVDAFHVEADGSILMSLDAATPNVAGLGRVEDSDVVRFIPTAHGNNTAGTFEWYLDGSDVGLSPTAEDITAITLDPAGRLVVSTVSNHIVPAATGTSSGTCDDLIVFNAAQTGQDSIGTWEKYFDGSDIGLSNDNIYGASIIDTGDLPLVHLTTKNSFSVSSGASFSGDYNDVFSCQTDSLGETTSCSNISLLVDMAAAGLGNENLDGFQDGSFTSHEVFGGQKLYPSSDGSGVIGGVAFLNEDIIVHDTSTSAWSMHFDGSDVGINGDVNAFHIEPNGEILMSLQTQQSVSGVGTVMPQDIIRFTPTSVGDDTSGSFALLLDGSDVGLSGYYETIDAISIDPTTGDLVISTLGNHDVPGYAGAAVTGNDRDLIRYTETLGADPVGIWSSMLVGATVGLDSPSEDITGLWIDPEGEVHVNTFGSYSVPGLIGGRADVFAPSTGELIYDGTANGIGNVLVDGIHVQVTPVIEPPSIPMALPLQPMAVDEVMADDDDDDELDAMVGLLF